MNAHCQAPLNFGQYPTEFLMFLSENNALWKRFEAEANKAWNRGFRHYSSKTIVEYIRHETALYERTGDFKINNNHTPHLARYYQELHPDRAGLFETRALRAVA
jgi:hypothetical protein